MRTSQLAAIALQAEKVHLQRLAKGYASRAVMGAVGGVLGVIALACLHVAGYDALCLVVAPYWAALIVFAVDLVAAGILFAVAARGGPDPVAQEALRVRDEAWNQIKSGVALGAAMRPLARVAGRKPVVGLTLAAMAARFLLRR